MLDLTSYEMLEVGRSFLDSSAVAFTRGLALGSAYLVVAYRVGKQLTTLQVTIVNAAFLLFCAQALFTAYIDEQFGGYLVSTVAKHGPFSPPDVIEYVGWVMIPANQPL